MMLQSHPAYRTQIDVLHTIRGLCVCPTIPADRVEHERWKPATGLLAQVAKRCRMEGWALGRAVLGKHLYVSGSLPPHLYGLLDISESAHLDVDDPLSLFVEGTRSSLPTKAFRTWAQDLVRRLGRVTLSFWSDVQLRNFLGNLHFEESAAMLESGAISVLPPAIPPRASDSSAGTRETVRCLCVASGKFWHKGVPETIVVIDRLVAEGLPITLSVVGAAVPLEWAACIQSRPYIEFAERLGRSQLEALFASHDLLIFLSHHDTYGWVLLEAKSHGMPAITTDFYSRPEIVRNGVDGVVVRDPFANPFLPIAPVSYAAGYLQVVNTQCVLVSPLIESYLEEITGALRHLVKNRAELRHLGQEALASVSPGGKFSVEKRVARLAQLLAA